MGYIQVIHAALTVQPIFSRSLKPTLDWGISLSSAARESSGGSSSSSSPSNRESPRNSLLYCDWGEDPEGRQGYGRAGVLAAAYSMRIGVLLAPWCRKPGIHNDKASPAQTSMRLHASALIKITN